MPVTIALREFAKSRLTDTGRRRVRLVINTFRLPLLKAGRLWRAASYENRLP
jgi:hypothetical protein